MQPFGQPLQAIFVASQSLPVHKDVKFRIIPFDDDVQACRHRSESSGVNGLTNGQFSRGYPINHGGVNRKGPESPGLFCYSLVSMRLNY
jgi:hypothetical protein